MQAVRESSTREVKKAAVHFAPRLFTFAHAAMLFDNTISSYRISNVVYGSKKSCYVAGHAFLFETNECTARTRFFYAKFTLGA